MYSGNNNNKASSLMDNTITVTPIKMEVEMPHVYPTTSGTTSISVTTSAASRRTSNVLSGNVTSTSASSTNAIITGTTPKDKTTKQPRLTTHKTPPTIDNFWSNILNDVKGIQQVDAKHQALPLARIKKIMKLDENAKMIAAEAPLLFAKACDYFIQELTMRAWVHTEENKRRTLQRSDIAQAIANYDQFDFLIDIVPREDIKPSTSSSSSNSQNSKKDTQTPSTTTTPATVATSAVAVPTATLKVEAPQMVTYGTLTPETLAAAASAAQQQVQPTQQLQILQQPTSQTHPQQLQYFITIPGQQHGQHQLVQQLQLQQPQLQQQLPNGLTLTTTSNNPQLAGLNIVAPQPQQLILTAGPNGQLTATPAPTAPSAQQQQQTALLQNIAQAQQQQQMGNQQQIQLLQQVVTPTGELTNVPITITANQLNLLRLQMQQQQHQQQQQAQQQVIIPTHCVGGAQQMVQIGTGGTMTATTSGSNPNSNTTTQLGQIQIHHHQPQQQQQQQHQQGQQQQQQHTTSGNTNIFLSTGQQQNSNSVVSTDRNLGSTFRTNC